MRARFTSLAIVALTLAVATPFANGQDGATVRLSGHVLVFKAPPGTRDNVRITFPAPSTLRVTDRPTETYTGAPVVAGAGCIKRGAPAAECHGAITRIEVRAGDLADQVANSTAVHSALFGGTGSDILIGGSYNDTISGGPDADVMFGMSGNDVLLARDLGSDQLVNCDGGGGMPGSADRAELDALPKDPVSIVKGCETRTRP